MIVRSSRTATRSSLESQEPERHFFLLGISDRTAPSGVREALCLPPERQRELALGLIAEGLVEEVAVLNTCNRLEVLGVSWKRCKSRHILSVMEGLTGGAEIDQSLFYLHRGRQALGHLLRVAGSLDSRIIGETHILGQVKQCYRRACDWGTSGKWLNIFFQKSFQVAKRIRSETNVTALPVSVGSCAVALIERVCGREGHVLVVGMGDAGRSVARHLSKHAISMTLCNRTLARAESLATELGAEVVGFAEREDCLIQVDVAVFAAVNPRPLLRLQEVVRLMSLRKNRPILLLDLGMPRNIDPAVGGHPSVFLYDIDAVQDIVEAHCSVRYQEAARAEELVSHSADLLWEKVHSVPVVSPPRSRKWATMLS